MLLSVIIPTYNIERYLRECLDSVMNQTYRNLEIIIIDDNSSDSTPEIITEYAAKDDRINPVFHETNQGPGNTRNEGLELATGDYVTFMDHDDWQALDKYEKMMAKAAKYKPDIVFCNAEGYNHNTGKRYTYYKVPPIFDEGALQEVNREEARGWLCSAFIPPWAKIIKSDIIKNNDIRFSVGGNKFDDVLFHYHLCMHAKKVIYVNKVLYTHRFFPDSITGKSQKNMDMMFDLFHTWEDLEEICLKHNIPPKAVLLYFTKEFAAYVYEVRSRQKFKDMAMRCLQKYRIQEDDYPASHVGFYRTISKYNNLRWVLRKLKITAAIKKIKRFLKARQKSSA